MNVSFRSGTDTINGALYLPDGGGPAPGVVVVPDVRGLYDHYHDVARRLADAGYAALAVDLYSRGDQPDTSSLETTFKFMRELPDRRVLADLQAAIDHLHAHEAVSERVGITGFCMGGKYTVLAACRCTGLAAAVAWYGMLRVDAVDEQNPEHPLDALDTLGCPLLGLFGAEDPIVPLDDVAELERRGASARHAVEVVTYPGAGHAFANDSRPQAYRRDAAEDGWRRMLAWFANTLGSGRG